MKQLIIGQNKSYAAGVTYEDLTQLPEGVIGIFNPSTGDLISSNATLSSSFAIACGRGEDKMPIHFPDVNLRTLSVTKAVAQDGTKFTSTITIPTTEKGKEYTIIIAKCGVVFNERNTWTFTSLAKSDIAANVAADLVKQINANTITSGVKAENTGGAITIAAVRNGENYTLTGADELMGIAPTNTTEAQPAILDKAYVQDLASRCAAGKGFNYLAEEDKEIYPGYPEVVEDTKYVLYTLRFAVPRVSAKQRDEVVYQLLHIAVPESAGCVGTLDSIFNLPTTSTTGGTNDVVGEDCDISNITGNQDVEDEE